MQHPVDGPARRWLIAGAALLVVLLTARLGWWQLDRANTKLAMQGERERAEALPPLDNAKLLAAPRADWAQRHTRLQGEWMTEHNIWLDNRPMASRSGFILLTPLRLSGSPQVIWVQRGWQAKAAGEHVAPPWPPNRVGTVSVEGRLAAQASRAFALGRPASGPLKQNLDLGASAADLRQAPLPWVLWQTRDCAPLRCEWPAPETGVAKHHGYAAQWFALSALTLGLYVWFQVIRPRFRRHEDVTA